MLHYYVKSAFSDRFLSPYINGSNLMVYYNIDKTADDIYAKKMDLQSKKKSQGNNILKEELNYQWL